MYWLASYSEWVLPWEILIKDLGLRWYLLVDEIFHDDFIAFDLFLGLNFQVFEFVSGLRVFEFALHVVHECFEFFNLFLR